MLISAHPKFAILNQCKTINQLKQAHAQTVTNGLISLAPCFILTKILYSIAAIKFPSPPSIRYANSIFRQIQSPQSTFAYNTIIRVHSVVSSPHSALQLFVEMRSSGVPPDSHTYPFLLKACELLSEPALLRSVHSQALKFGFSSHIHVTNKLIHAYSGLNSMDEAQRVFDQGCWRDIVSYNALIAGYVKASEMGTAREVFDEMPTKDAVSWGTLVMGYAQAGQCKQGLELFDQMLALGVHPDNVALVGALSSCAQLGALEKGMAIHDYVKQAGIGCNVFLCTGLVDMYAKCGCISTAMEVFESSHDKNVFTWNAVITGVAMHGHGEQALELFMRMQNARIRPDKITLLAVLVGCSHVGLVDDARQLFNEMECIHGVCRGLSHYGCMVDLLGRAGLIQEALELIESMPMEGDVYVWGGLLGGCRIHGNVEVAEIAAGHLIGLAPDGAGTYSIMANIYAKAKRWEDVAKMRRLMCEMRLNKNRGCSWIQVEGVDHEFVAGERWHPQIDEIHSVLNGIVEQCVNVLIFSDG
ncbi:hypothetical protein ACLOJK_023760 [Asimina triloba]